MSWIPRFPEVKEGLHLTNGSFGSLISTGGLGSLLSLLTVGHIVHKFGVKVVMQISAFVIALSLIALVHTNSILVFLIATIVLGAAISGLHISISSQGFYYQDRTGKLVITQLSGIWSAGALVTAVLAGLLIDRLSLKAHITILALTVLFLMLLTINKLTENLIKPNTEPDKEYHFRDLFKDFHFDKLITGGLLCAISLEFAIGDWAAIFTKEEAGIKGGLNTLPYILFTLTMIIGRLSANRLLAKYTIEKLVRRGAILSGMSFAITIFLSRVLNESHKGIALLILCVGFSVAGLGSSFLTPIFMSAANARTPLPSSVVVGHIGLVNNCLIFGLRWLIAWIAQFFSLSIALAIPALALLLVPYFAKATKSIKSV